MDDGGWGQLSSDQLMELIGDEIVKRNKADARIVALLGYLDQRGVVGEKGYGSAAVLYADLALVTIGTAKRGARFARHCQSDGAAGSWGAAACGGGFRAGCDH